MTLLFITYSTFPIAFSVFVCRLQSFVVFSKKTLTDYGTMFSSDRGRVQCFFFSFYSPTSERDYYFRYSLSVKLIVKNTWYMVHSYQFQVRLLWIKRISAELLPLNVYTTFNQNFNLSTLHSGVAHVLNCDSAVGKTGIKYCSISILIFISIYY